MHQRPDRHDDRPRTSDPSSLRRASALLAACSCFALQVIASPRLATAAPPVDAQVLAPAKDDGAAGRLVRSLAQAIVRDVAAVRGLPLRRPIEVGVHDDESLRGFVLAELRKDGGTARRAALSLAWSRLGLLPPGTDLLGETVQLLQAQVAGFYVPGVFALRVARGLVPLGPQWPNPLHLLTGTPEEKLRFVMAHELVHALGDQRWDLQRASRERPGETDVELASSALVEGDATVAGLAWAMQDRSPLFDPAGLFLGGDNVTWILELAMKLARRGLLPDAGGLDRAPAALAESLLFPYVAGTRLVLAAGAGRRVGGRRLPPGFAGVDALYEAPPISTEQVLHPERLLGTRDDPVRIQLRVPRKLLPRRARLAAQDIIGELLFRVLLRATLPDAEADRAAEGWDGDLLLHWQAKSGEDALLWISVWDTDEDAAEAEAALRRRFDPAGDLHILRRGDALALARGADAARTLRLLTFALDKHRRRPGRSAKVPLRRRL